MFFEDINVVYVEQVIKKKNNDPACKVPSSLQSSGSPRNSALHLFEGELQTNERS
jgi:hypothetical protein